MYLGYQFWRSWDFLYIMPEIRGFFVDRLGGRNYGGWLSSNGFRRCLMDYSFLFISLLNHK